MVGFATPGKYDITVLSKKLRNIYIGPKKWQIIKLDWKSPPNRTLREETHSQIEEPFVE